jgi:nucleoside-diphosphate-sugar epimerase
VPVNHPYPAAPPARPAAGAGTGPRGLLVLGATGTVGRHVTAALRAAGDAVTPVSRGGPAPLDLTAAGPEELAGLLRRYRPDVVVNACGRIWHATDEELWAVNAEAVARLAAVMAELPWRPRLVHLGSVHEYGPGDPGAGIREDRAPAPVTPYGRAKLGGTRAVLDAVRTRALDAVVLRVANVFGPATSTSSVLGGVAEHLVRAERERRRDDPPVRLRLAPLRARRDFVDVRDVADAVVAAAHARTVTDPAPAAHADRPRAAEPVINVGSGTAVLVRALVDRLVALSGVPVRIERTADQDPRRVDVEWQRLDIGRARRLLDWRPRRDPDASLRDLLASRRQETTEGLR